MENASKALLMAGGVLIAILIIGALILMFNSLSDYQNTNQQTNLEAQVVEFNNQYVTYDNENVRGSDLYSLLNKVIDYNRRQSTAATGWSDSGQQVRFVPMTIVMEIKSEDLAQFSPDGTQRLIKNTKYTINATNNTFEEQVKNTIDDLEAEYGADSLNGLTTAMTKIFIDSTDKDSRIEAIKTFNSVSRKKNISIKSNATDAEVNTAWNTLQGYKNDVYTYYEYVQFKRLHFECTGTNYDGETGRITEMQFRSTGNFN